MLRSGLWALTLAGLLALSTGCETTPTTAPTSRDKSASKTAVDPIKLGAAVRRIDVLIAQRRVEEIGAKACPGTAEEALCQFVLDYANPDRNAAWKAFNKRAKRDPFDPHAQLGMQLIYIEWKIDDQAELCYQRAVKLLPTLAVAHARMGNAYARKGNIDRARQHFELALKADSSDADALLGLARLDVKLGEAERAVERYRAAAAAWPLSPEPSLEAAALAEAAGDLAGAETLYREAAARAPRDVELRRILAALLVRNGKTADARAVYEEAATVDPKDFAVLAALATLADKAGDEDGAFAYYQRAAAAKDDDLKVQRAVSRGYLKRGQMAGAEQAFAQVLKLEPTDSEAHLALARINSKAQRYRDAVGHYRAALASKPDGEVDSERKKLEASLHISGQPARGHNVDATFGVALKAILEAYKMRLRQRSKLRGQVTLDVAVAPDGSVAKVQIVEDTLKDESLLACIFWNVSDAKFPKADKTRHFTYPITFDR